MVDCIKKKRIVFWAFGSCNFSPGWNSNEARAFSMSLFHSNRCIFLVPSKSWIALLFFYSLAVIEGHAMKIPATNGRFFDTNGSLFGTNPTHVRKILFVPAVGSDWAIFLSPLGSLYSFLLCSLLSIQPANRKSKTTTQPLILEHNNNYSKYLS